MRLAVQAASLTASLAIALPATAECVTAETLVKGVAFTRANGMGGIARRDGTAVRIEYKATAVEGNQDERAGPFGIYETETISESTNPDVIDGWGRTDVVTRFARRVVEPVAGEAFTTSWRAKSTYCGGSTCPIKWVTKGSATYRFLQSQTLRISGCSYSAIPVEATMLSDHVHYTQRWLYFPELGFGVETRVTGHLKGTDRKLGLTSMRPAP